MWGWGVVQGEGETKAVKHILPSLYFINLHILDFFLKGKILRDKGTPKDLTILHGN